MFKRLGAWAGLAVTLVLFECSSSAAFVLLNPFRKWLSQDVPASGVPFIIDNRGEDSVTVADGSLDNGLTEVIGSVEYWNKAIGRPIVASPVRTDLSTLNNADGMNSIVFNDPLGICIGSCLAVTFIGRYDSGTTETTNGINFNRYIEADITFNATVDWTTHADAGSVSCNGEFDIEGVAAHEMGHALGLGHSSNPNATMYAYTSACNPEALPLDPDDVAAARCEYINAAGCGGCENCPVLLETSNFACGGSSFTSSIFGVWPLGGNLVRFESPLGVEHIQVGSIREGYILCYSSSAGPAVAFDLTNQAGGFLAPAMSQPGGPGSFPFEFIRTTDNGLLRLRQRYTGNSFVAPGGGALDLNGDGLVCNSLEECGNCTNRTVHLLMELTNLSTAPIKNIVLVRSADLQVDGEPAANEFTRTTDSVMAFVDAAVGGERHGIVMQGIGGDVLPEALVQTVERSDIVDCASESLTTPALGDLVGKLRWPLGTLAPGETKQVRMHYRRW